MKKMIIAILLLAPFSISAVEYSKMQPDNSSISFVSRQMGVPVGGVFKKFSAKLRINPAKPEAGVAHLAIELASIDAGSVEANDEVKGKSWFNVAEFPTAEFVSSSVRTIGAGKFEAVGKMTIRGKSMEVRAPFTLKEDKGVLSVDGAFTLKRLDFGIGSGLWSDTSVVADEVQIKFHLLLK
jgi:polyisoprenoid-binding protein YceI